MINKNVDYLQFSVEHVPEFLGAPLIVGKSPLPYYQYAEKFPCGAAAHKGNKLTGKYLVQMPGTSCERWQMTDYPNRVVHIQTTGGKFSRIDFAITVSGSKPLKKFQKAVQEKRIQSKRFHEEDTRIISDAQSNAQTIYLGMLTKRAKKGVFRAYDKGLERGLLESLTRFELEVRREEADTAARRWSNGEDIGNLIRHVVDIPGAKWWEDMIGAKSEALPRWAREEPDDDIANKWHWLYTQVAPALARLILVDQSQNTRNYEGFMKEVQKQLDRYRWVDTTSEIPVL